MLLQSLPRCCKVSVKSWSVERCTRVNSVMAVVVSVTASVNDVAAAVMDCGSMTGLGTCDVGGIRFSGRRRSEACGVFVLAGQMAVAQPPLGGEALLTGANYPSCQAVSICPYDQNQGRVFV